GQVTVEVSIKRTLPPGLGYIINTEGPASVPGVATMSALGQKQTCALQTSCLLYSQKRTCAVHHAMSALGQKRTSDDLAATAVYRCSKASRVPNAMRIAPVVASIVRLI